MMMMRNTMFRLLLVAAVVAVVHVGFKAVGIMVQPPTVRMPSHSLSEMPLRLGPWQGQETKLDPRLTEGSEAEVAASRAYTGPQDRLVSMFTAIYTKVDRGVYHSPLNCYQSSGWTKISETHVPLRTEGRPSIDVDLSMWDKGGERVYVLFWYELGEHVLFERFDLGKVRMAMRGRAEWPPLVKVLLQTSAARPDSAKGEILDLAGRVREWLPQLDAPAASAPAKK
jgi:EpsI family protein